MSLSRQDALRERRLEEKSSSKQGDEMNDRPLVMGGEGRTAGDVLSSMQAIVVLLFLSAVAFTTWLFLSWLGL